MNSFGCKRNSLRYHYHHYENQNEDDDIDEGEDDRTNPCTSAYQNILLTVSEFILLGNSNVMNV